MRAGIFREWPETEAQPLVGLHELSVLFRVSSQRADQLTHTAKFPRPVAQLASGRVWRRSAVEKWAKETGRELLEPDT